MKKTLIGMVIIASVSSINAMNLVYVSPTTNSENGLNGNMFLDYDSFVFTDNTRTIRSGWVKTMYDYGSYKYDRFEAHCPSRMYRLVGQYNYSPTNVLLKSLENPTQWQYTIPGSVGENLANTICTTNVRSR